MLLVTATAPGAKAEPIGLLQHFVVTLDWPRETVWLAPRAGEPPRRPAFPTAGFALALHEGALVVSFLWQDSPATGAGLRLGDRVIAIDEQLLSRVPFETFCRLSEELPSHDGVISLTVTRAGSTRAMNIRPEPLVP